MTDPPHDERRIEPWLLALMALTTGVAVANLYYVQPLLNVVARTFGVSDGTAGLLVTCTQLGYVTGLALVVPAGDLVQRRRLIAGLLAAGAVTSAVSAAAPDFLALAVSLAATAVFSVAAQVVVPLASSLAAPSERGHVVGVVMSGLLIGILLARTLSGLIADLGGWRLVFVVAAAVMIAMAAVLSRALPHVPPPAERTGYRTVLRSVLALVREQPVLRQRMALGALCFGGFSTLWTTVTFLLGAAPYGYSEGVIGLFGLAGAAGAAAAPVAGRLADRGHGRLAMSGFLAALLASWGLLALGRHSLIALIAGIIVLDLGVQGAQISNQTTIYALVPEARSRLTTAYMVSVFLGGLICSALASALYDAGGWAASCVLGVALAAAAIGVWAVTSRAFARRGATGGRPRPRQQEG